MSSDLQSTLVLAALAVLVLAAMALGWRRRGRRSAAVVGRVPEVPDAGALGETLLGPLEATYVSTTTAGDWLDRVVAHDLGVRSAASVQVHPAGVVIRRTGARDVFLPADALRAVERTPGMAGKYVGGQGLVVVRWEIGPGRLLDTGLRVRRAADRPVLTAAVAALVPPQTPDRPSTEESP